MDYTYQAIRRAGYADHGKDEMYARVYGPDGQFDFELFLDPSFWRALGKSLGWSPIDDEKYYILHRLYLHDVNMDGTYLTHWHRFIDHLAEGKDTESFFKALLQ